MSELKLEKKKCFNCQAELKLEEVLEANKNEWPEWFIKSAFKGKLVQMYCCSCYRAKTNGEVALKGFKKPFSEIINDYDYDDEWGEYDDDDGDDEDW